MSALIIPLKDILFARARAARAESITAASTGDWGAAQELRRKARAFDERAFDAAFAQIHGPKGRA